VIYTKKQFFFENMKMNVKSVVGGGQEGVEVMFFCQLQVKRTQLIMTQEHDTKRQKIQDASSKLFDLIQQLLEHPETELTDQLAIIKRVLEGERGLKELTSEKVFSALFFLFNLSIVNRRMSIFLCV
jgi:hypothetical protein